MISVEVGTLVLLYVLLPVGLFFALWVLFEEKDKFKSFGTSRELIWQCSICTYIYLNSRNDVISTCPRCGSYNKKETHESVDRKGGR